MDKATDFHRNQWQVSYAIMAVDARGATACERPTQLRPENKGDRFIAGITAASHQLSSLSGRYSLKPSLPQRYERAPK